MPMLADYTNQYTLMKFIKVTQHKGKSVLYINPQHIMLIDSLINGGAMLYNVAGAQTKVDQSVEEVLALIAQ
jgi:hypothetical protein